MSSMPFDKFKEGDLCRVTTLGFINNPLLNDEGEMFGYKPTQKQTGHYIFLSPVKDYYRIHKQREMDFDLMAVALGPNADIFVIHIYDLIRVVIGENENECDHKG